MGIQFRISLLSFPTYRSWVDAALHAEQLMRRMREQSQERRGNKRQRDGQPQGQSSGQPRGDSEAQSGGTGRDRRSRGQGPQPGSHYSQGSVVQPVPWLQSQGASSAPTQGEALRCSECGRAHRGQCLKDFSGCYGCGETGHLKRNCPRAQQTASAPPLAAPAFPPPQQGSAPPSSSRASAPAPQLQIGDSAGRTRAQARVYAATQQEAAAAPDVVTGTMSIMSYDACVLIDPGSTHSYMSASFASHVEEVPNDLIEEIIVSTPVGNSVNCNKVYKDCLIVVDGCETRADLVLLPLNEFDVILGMDWLSRQRAKVDCYEKLVTFEDSEGRVHTFIGVKRMVSSKVISALAATRLLKKGLSSPLSSCDRHYLRGT